MQNIYLLLHLQKIRSKLFLVKFLMVMTRTCDPCSRADVSLGLDFGFGVSTLSIR